MKKWLNLIPIFEGQMSSDYPPILRDSREIAEYIESLASDETDSELIEDYFHGAHAVLELVSLSDISEGNPDGNIPSSKKERKYLKMSPDTIPPLVIENGIVMDGNHRFRVAKKLGLTQLWCYVVQG